MRVAPHLRHKTQSARNVDEFFAVLAEIEERGPAVGSRTDQPEMTVAVPSGPNAHW
jgi:hypothetical protein